MNELRQCPHGTIPTTWHRCEFLGETYESRPTKPFITKSQRAEYDRLSLVHATFERRPEQLLALMCQRPNGKKAN